MPIPASGKLIQLEVLLSGRWQTFRTARTDQSGRWALPYRFARTRGVQWYRFRVLLPRGSGIPIRRGRLEVAASPRQRTLMNDPRTTEPGKGNQVLHRLRKRLTYANVMSTLAVFIALGGSSYAAFTINGATIKNRSIAGKKLRHNTLTRNADQGVAPEPACRVRSGPTRSADSPQRT